MGGPPPFKVRGRKDAALAGVLPFPLSPPLYFRRGKTRKSIRRSAYFAVGINA